MTSNHESLTATGWRPRFDRDEAIALAERPSKPPALFPGIGGTALLELSRIGADLSPHVRLFAKAEHANPGGSVKDRAAHWMIRDGFSSGKLRKGVTLIDATSGNTGVAYAMIGARIGIRVKLALPDNASPERKAILRAHGAELTFTDPLKGTDGAQRKVKALVAADPNRYFYPDQYSNDANWRGHFFETASEILRQTEGMVTHFVAALGTTGTFTGVSRRLHLHREGIVCVSVQPESPLHGLEGMKHLPSTDVPGIYDPTVADDAVTVETEAAFAMTRRLAREEGLLVGPSSGANVLAALDLANKLDEGVVVTVLCDSGTRYLSSRFWSS